MAAEAYQQRILFLREKCLHHFQTNTNVCAFITIVWTNNHTAYDALLLVQRMSIWNVFSFYGAGPKIFWSKQIHLFIIWPFDQLFWKSTSLAEHIVLDLHCSRLKVHSQAILMYAFWLFWVPVVLQATHWHQYSSRPKIFSTCCLVISIVTSMTGRAAKQKDAFCPFCTNRAMSFGNQWKMNKWKTLILHKQSAC